MAQIPLKDLAPRYDIKGGNPKSPTPPYSVQEYQQYAQPPPVSNGNGVYKMLAGAAGGLWIMSMVAYWTAFQGKGITRDELRNEMKESKDSISAHTTVIDSQIGELKGQLGKLTTDVNQVQYRQNTDEQNFTEFKAEQKQSNKLVADWMEAQKVKK